MRACCLTAQGRQMIFKLPAPLPSKVLPQARTTRHIWKMCSLQLMAVCCLPTEGCKAAAAAGCHRPSEGQPAAGARSGLPGPCCVPGDPLPALTEHAVHMRLSGFAACSITFVTLTPAMLKEVWVAASLTNFSAACGCSQHCSSGHVRTAPIVTAVKAAIQHHCNKRCPACGCSQGCCSKQGFTAQSEP